MAIWGLLDQHDVLMLISNSGRTREVLELQSLARQLVPAIKMVVLTSKQEGGSDARGRPGVADRRPPRGVSAGPDTHHFNHDDVGGGRCAGGVAGQSERLPGRRLCKAASQWVSGGGGASDRGLSGDRVGGRLV